MRTCTKKSAQQQSAHVSATADQSQIAHFEFGTAGTSGHGALLVSGHAVLACARGHFFRCPSGH